MKEKVSEFQLEVGSSVWDAIEEQIDNQGGKRRRFGAIWWLFSGLALSAFLYLTANTFFSNSTPVNTTRFSSSKQKLITNTSEPQQKTEISEESLIEQTNENPQESIVLPTTSPKNTLPQRSIKPAREAETLPDSPQVQAQKNETIRIIEQVSTSSEESLMENIEDDVAEPSTILLASDSVVPMGEKEDRKVDSRSRWSLMVYAGPGISYRTLKGQNAQGIVDHRNSHEKTTFTYDAGISGQINWRRSSYLRFGLSYSRYAEKYEFHHNAISHATKNTYGYGQLNINYGERLVNFGSGELSFFGGLGAGRLLHAQSSWIDPNALVPVVHSNTQANQPFENWIFNFRFGVDYQMYLFEKLEFHIIPGMEGLINSSYKKETQLNQHPYAFNLNVGISYSF